MGIKKEQFYEGAALQLLARSGRLHSVYYESPFYVLNEHMRVLVKYSTRGRSPWGFTFTPGEQSLLNDQQGSVIIGLVCGSDGIAALPLTSYKEIASRTKSAIHIACYRSFGQHYEVNGPDGALPGKVAPINWERILNSEEAVQ